MGRHRPLEPSRQSSRKERAARGRLLEIYRGSLEYLAEFLQAQTWDETEAGERSNQKE